jgi:hypothetical protein
MSPALVPGSFYSPLVHLLDCLASRSGCSAVAGDDKSIRPLKDNSAGKVVADEAGSRWEWDRAQHDDTSRLLRKLSNDELAIEQTNIRPKPYSARGTREAAAPSSPSKPLKKPSRDAGGGFDPYDNSGKPGRR